MSQRLAATVLVAAMGLAACDTPAPMPRGAAVIATTGDADVLVPAHSRTNVGAAVGEQLFLRLAEMGPDLNTTGDDGFIPELAEAWEFEDSLTIVFHLHPDARWHDGRAVTAADVAFTFDVYRDTLAAVAARPLLASVARVEVRDRLAAVFRFTHAYAEQFYDAVHHMRIVPRHLLDTVPRERLATHPFMREPVGSGPYRFVRWVPGETIELAADTGFFRGPAGVARLIWRVTPDFGTAITQVAAGEADVLEAVVGPENIRRVREAEGVRLVDYASPVYMYVGFNLRDRGRSMPHPLFGDRGLRRALTLGTNRDVLVQAVLDGRGEVPRGPITPMVWIWDGAPRQLPFDLTAARQALDALGWGDADGDGVRERQGRRLAFDLLVPGSSVIRQRAAVILQEQWRALGADVRLVELEFNTFNARAAAGRFDTYMGALAIDPAPSGIRQLWTAAGVGGSNYGAYADPVFDSLVTAATRTVERGAARRVWHQALKRINEDAPAVWLFTPSLAAGVADRFWNVTIRPDLWATFLWEWRIQEPQPE